MESEAIKANLSRKLVDFIEKNTVGYEILPLENDLSRRKYYRIRKGIVSYIVMDSTLEPEQFSKFILSTYFLNKHKFSVPKIVQIDFESSIALIEDFGDISVSSHLVGAGLGRENEIYKKSLYLLSELQKVSVTGVNFEVHSRTILLNGIEQFVDNCVLEFYKPDVQNELTKLVSQLTKPETLSLRDFHVDNIMWLDNREGINKVGLLDYQDIAIGYKAYDVVSLLQDARRFIPRVFEQQMLDFFIAHNPDINQEEFLHEYKILSLQRNLRIYGLFTHCVVDKGMKKYQKYLPNVKNYIERELDDALLSDHAKKIILHSL